MSAPTITSQTRIPDIIGLLSQHGCPDITHDLDLLNCTGDWVNCGGQGDIYKGVLVNGDCVAIKIGRGDPSIDVSKGNKSFKRIARELYTWFTLRHPNIAELLGMAVFRGHIAMISPWITPGNFYQFITEFPEADRMDLCLHVADGLAYLHANQVIFGDLKAQNILIGLDGVAKLTDFGLSILQKSHIIFSITSSTGGGSTRWMAPELFESSATRSFEADVYALAMTFIEILTDTIPFPHIDDDMKVMYAVSFKNAVPDRPKRLEVGSSRYNEWWLLLSQCWSRQPETRPKAADWKTLDSSLSMQRTQQLSEQLAFALCYGRTMSGPLKNLDTGEELPPNISTATLPVFELVDSSSLETQMQSKEALLKALIDLRTSATVTRNAYLDVSYVQNLQYSIYRDLEERIQRVRYWTTINTAHFSQKNQNVRDLFANLDTIALEMQAAARICSAQCSGCALLCLRVHGHVNGEHDCNNECPIKPIDLPEDPACRYMLPPGLAPNSFTSTMFARVPNLYRELAAKDATRCIRVQDLDRVLASYLPNKDAVALGIEWQHGWYLPHESLVLVVAEPRSLDRQRLWWVRLALFLRQDFITPHCTAYFVQRPQRVVQANTRFVNGLAFEQVLRVVHLLHETIKDYPDLEMDSWFYAAVLFELITDIEEPSKVTPIKWKDKTRLTHQNHPTANRIQREQYQELSNRVRQVLNLESTNRPHHVDDRIGRTARRSWMIPFFPIRSFFN